jgi:hypothetical protein
MAELRVGFAPRLILGIRFSFLQKLEKVLDKSNLELYIGNVRHDYSFLNNILL